MSCLYFRFDIGLVAVGAPAGFLQVSEERITEMMANTPPPPVESHQVDRLEMKLRSCQKSVFV